MKKIIISLMILVCLSPFCSGCGFFLADVKGLNAIKQAHTKIFEKDVSDCYTLTIKALDDWKATAFQSRKNDYIVAMDLDKKFRNCTSTTELGIFFTSNTPHRTEIKVTSLNYYLSQFISSELFEYIEKDGNVPANLEAPEGSKPSKFKL